jgi:FMN-dependent oxidoreductase (nitrilotriacetate monooxygenase family)
VHKQFHLGWFVDGFRVPAWNQTWSGSSDHDWAQKFYVDMARSLDRAKFDFMLFADIPGVKEMFDGSRAPATKIGIQYIDPMSIAPIIAWETEGLGVFPTASTSDWNPYLLARLLSSMDHVTNGRMGWNMVTGGNKDVPANFGHEFMGHDDRYRKANEFAEVMMKLWNSWDDDAVVRDYENNTYIDGSKTHTIDHKGEFFASRGPLAVPPTPQHHPVLAQAGASDVGKDFAAKYADVVIGASYGGVAGMKAYREDIHRRAIDHGRSPDDIRVMFLIAPTVAATQAEAEERFRLAKQSPEVDAVRHTNLINLSLHWSIDLFKLDLDKPLPKDLTTQGHQAELATMQASGRTLGDLAANYDGETALVVVGTPDQVASELQAVHEETGCDGFLINNLFLTRRYISEITDGLVPVLQRRGLTRTDYSSKLFRENLFSF